MIIFSKLMAPLFVFFYKTTWFFETYQDICYIDWLVTWEWKNHDCRCSDTTDSSSETSSDEHKGTSSKRSSLRVRFSAAIDSVRNRIYKDSTPTKKYLKNYS